MYVATGGWLWVATKRRRKVLLSNQKLLNQMRFIFFHKKFIEDLLKLIIIKNSTKSQASSSHPLT